MNIESSVFKIEKIKEHFFVVPDYQREYVWKHNVHVKSLLDDINEAFEQSDSNKPTSYFIGSIILVQRKDGSMEVIDGQQRLTTIFLSLCAFRDVLKTTIEFSSVQEQKHHEYLITVINSLISGYNLDTLKEEPRIHVQYDNGNAFINDLCVNSMQKEYDSASVKKMSLAYTAAVRFFKNTIQLSKRYEFIRYFLQQVELIAITERDGVDSALKIFETINQRGVRLDAMDLLKNLIFSKADPDDYKEITRMWRDLKKHLDDCNEGIKPLRFLRYFFLAKYYTEVEPLTEKGIYEWIKKPTVKESINYDKEPMLFAETLLQYSDYYSALVSATKSEFSSYHDGDYKIQNIGHLGKSTTRQHLILLLSIDPSLLRTKRSRESIINWMSENIERLFFWFYVANEPAKKIEQKFVAWAQKIREKKDETSLRRYLMGIFKEEKKLLYNRINLDVISTFPPDRIKYILCRIENFIAVHSGCNTVDLLDSRMLADIELEHIMPKGAYNRHNEYGLSEAEFDRYVNSLGNLTILEQGLNRKLGKSRFDEKHDVYISSNYYITSTINTTFESGKRKDSNLNKVIEKYLSSYSEWNKDSIEDRKRKLYAIIEEIWDFE